MNKIIIIILSIALLASCTDKKQQEAANAPVSIENGVSLTDAQMKNAAIATGKIERKNISTVLRLRGSIDVPPQNLVSISVPLGGYLKSTKLLPGMHISKGETIAVMEDQQYIQLQQDYLTAKAQLEFSEAEYNRQKELNQSKAGSDKVFQQAQADYTSNKVMVKSLSEKLKLIAINPGALNENNLSRSINIPSPINGFVSKVNVNIGKYVNPEDVLFEIVNPEDIHLSLNVFENDIDKLFVGQKLMAYSNINPVKKYECEIILIGKDFSNDRSVEAHCHFKNYDKNLIPGMFMNAEIETQSDSSWVLPSDAIVTFENKQYVYITKGKNQFQMTEVQPGSNENGYTQIIFPASQDLSNETFVTKGAYSLLMKMKNTEEE